MAAALRRQIGTALTAFRSTKTYRTASSELLVRRRYSSSASSLSFRQCASAANHILLDDAVLAVAPPAVETSPSLLERRVVVYDGVCHLCHSGVKWIIRADKDKKIKFCCLQSKAAEPYMKLCGLEREDVLRRFLFVEGPGSYHQGSDAALRVLSYLPLPYSALSNLKIVPKPLREAIYDYVAKQRYNWFGKGDDCLVLKEMELVERFIDWEELLDRSQRHKW